MDKELFFEQGTSANGVTAKEKIKELFWSVINDTLFRFTLRPMNVWRAFLLRLFGAEIARGVYTHQTVKILRPWNLIMGTKASLDYGCAVRNDAKVFIGDNVSVGAYTTFMPGGHDVRSRGFEFIGKETHIAHGVFIGGQCLIRDVNIGQFSVIGAGSFVTKDIPENVIAFGWPAKVRSERIPNKEYKKYRYDR